MTNIWYFQCWVAFIASSAGMLYSIYNLPIDSFAKNMMLLATLFMIASTANLAKAVRDRVGT